MSKDFFWVAIGPMLFNEDMHEGLDEFEVRPDSTTNCGVSSDLTTD